MSPPLRLPLIVGFCLCLGSATLSAEFVISEILAENRESSVDEDGDPSDWIEIWNPSGEPASIGGYSLTDDPGVPNKWILPDLTVPPGGFLLVFASGKNRTDSQRPLHTNFSLEKDGEFLGLHAPGSESLVSGFTPTYPEQFEDIAYGITGANPDDIGYLLTPTPSGSNGEVMLGFVGDTQFSLDRGFYSAPITVSVTSATEGAQIRYTLDGSLPTAEAGLLYDGPIPIETTTILRAMAMRDRHVSSNVDTQTYLFPDSVRVQKTMDARVTEAPAYAEQMNEALGGTLPALSIVGSHDALFGLNGIYTEFERRGRRAEVPISLEYFSPTDPEDTFHIAGGLRIHGGNARSHPKKPLRVYFREEYSGGNGELQHPLFEGSPVDCFEQLILRSGGHDSWSLADRFGGSDFDLPAHATFLRDQFLRQTENDMGLLSPLGKYVHVYLNGVYWGVYDLHERPNAAYFSQHLGGEKADWDVVHHPEFSDETYSIVSGDAAAWESLQSIATGGISDRSGFERIQEVVDLEGYIDSMIVRMWAGDYDWCGPIYRPITSGGQTVYQNVTVFGNKNWYAGRRSRNGGESKFHFFSWDAEMSMGLHLMFNLFGNTRQRVVDFDLSQASDPGSPVAPYQALISYPPFQRAFSDRLHKHLHQGGALSPEKTQPRLQALVDQLELPILAESARWGNTSPAGQVFTRDDTWRPEIDWLRDTFLMERGDAMLKGFRYRGLYPVPPAPVLSQPGGFLASGRGVNLSTSNPADTIYYTTDGTDPAELPVTETLELLPPRSPCTWLVPNASNGALSSQFRWNLVSGAPNEKVWWDGRLGLGFEEGDQNFKSHFNTDVGAVMHAAEGNGLYCRIPFSIPSEKIRDEMDAFILRIRYDDGFVAYVNGVRVASANAPTRTDARSSALETRSDEEALQEETFDVTTTVRSRLLVGHNLLAIHGLNSIADDDDFLLEPRLQLRREVSPGSVAKTAKITAGAVRLDRSATVKARILDAFGRWSALTEAYFFLEAPLQPGDLAVSEIHYRPAPPRGTEELAHAATRSAFEFLELQNRRLTPLELGGVTFVQGIRFTFPEMTLAPGDRVVVVRDRAAFQARYGAEALDRVAGIFARDTKLSDTGERLTLLSREGETLLSFRYNDRDPWPESADGEGRSLVYWPLWDAADPNEADHWAASLDPDGYPGLSGFTRFASWASRHFAEDETSMSLPEADPDGDRLSNLLEYVFGSHPRRPTEKTAFMTFASAEIDGQTQPVFEFLRRPGMEDVAYEIEFSGDLEEWVTMDLREEDLIRDDNVLDRERVRFPLETPLPPSRYARLRVTLVQPAP